jgi:DNA-binding response OmpR family regulator
MASVVIVEDEQRIRELVARALANEGHDVESASNAMDGLQAVVRGSPDLVILDMGLPDLDGTELLKMIRAVSEVPIIVATARSEDRDIIRTLDAGADDYLVKPFSVEQLEARVRAVLRRVGSDGRAGPIVVGELVVDAAARVARLDGTELELSPKEFDVLRYLAERVGEVVSKRELLAEVWRQPYGGGEKTVDVHISWLRKKLGESAAEPRFVQTVFGVGVKLVEPET